MSITYPLSVPDENFRNAVMTPEQVVGITVSPFTKQRQTVEHDGACWRMQVELPPIKNRVRAQAWAAMLTALKGPIGSFRMGYPWATAPAGDPQASSPMTDGTFAAGTTEIDTYNWPTSKSGLLLAGDLIELTGTDTVKRLHRVLNQVDSNGAGEATLDIWPPLRFLTLTDTDVVYASPKGTWRLDGPVPLAASHLRIYGVDFLAVESL